MPRAFGSIDAQRAARRLGFRLPMRTPSGPNHIGVLPGEADARPRRRCATSALPPYTRLGLAPAKRLLVFLVLNEPLDAVREILRDRLPLGR